MMPNPGCVIFSFPELPVEFVRTLSNLEIYEKQTAVFECEVSKPNQSAKWFQAGTEIAGADFSRFTPEVDATVHRLTIVDAELDDTMKYSCCIGDKKTSAKLNVLGECFIWILVQRRSRHVGMAVAEALRPNKPLNQRWVRVLLILSLAKFDVNVN